MKYDIRVIHFKSGGSYQKTEKALAKLGQEGFYIDHVAEVPTGLLIFLQRPKPVPPLVTYRADPPTPTVKLTYGEDDAE